jgi:hypothetical protein
VPKQYQYTCEKHGPWTDFHADKRATYDCPQCDAEQRQRYASLYGREITLAHLLQIANDPNASQRKQMIARRLGDVVATHGIATANGWLDGWWYSAGNNDPDNNEAWTSLRTILGGM